MPTRAKSPPPISSRAKSQTGLGCLLVFFGVFFAAGWIAFFFLFVKPAMNILAASDWPAVPCVVESSRVVEHPGDDGPTYSVEVVYNYTASGQEHTSSRYDFAVGNTAGYHAKKEIVDRYPPGTQTTCYVDPDDPTSAVIERGFTATMWFGLLPLIFVLVGLGGIAFALRARRKVQSAAGKVDWLPALQAARTDAWQDEFARAGFPSAESAGSVTLKPESTRLKTLLVIILVCLFWNGLVGFFVYLAYTEWRKGDPQWFLMVFLVPFVLVGLALVAAVVHSFMALFNPQPTVTLSTDRVRLGDTLDVAWSFSGSTGSLNRLRLYLEGSEQARYRRGTDTYTDEKPFARVELADTTSVVEMPSGQACAAIPNDLMHSFDGGNNKIIWALHLHGEVSWWPDVKSKYPLLVLPLKAKGRS